MFFSHPASHLSHSTPHSAASPILALFRQSNYLSLSIYLFLSLSIAMEHQLDRTQYVAQRVQATLTGRICRVFCSIFLTLSLIAAILLFILWLNLRPHRPRFHLSSFTVSGLSENRTLDVSFRVLLRNPNQKIGIFYVDSMTGQLFYNDINIGGGAIRLLSPFYQPPKNTTDIVGEFMDESLMSRIGGDVASRGEVWFRLRIDVTVRFRVKTWDTHLHEMRVDCDAGVGTDGEILPEAKNRGCSIFF